MRVYRKITEENVEAFRIGDVINFTLTTGEEVEAMAMREEKDGMLFVTADCLEEERSMNEENITKGGYEKSALRKVLNSEIYDTFPEDIKEKMVPFANGDFLRLLTEDEVFGDERLEPMNNRRNRIADRGAGSDEAEWWWLQDVYSAASFALVSYSGSALCSAASRAFGVRPAFKINI